MLALLADAINVYQQGVLSRNTRKSLLFIDAERWIMAGSKAATPSASTPLRRARNQLRACCAAGCWPGSMKSGATSRPRRNPHLRLKITPRTKHLSQAPPRIRAIPPFSQASLA